MSFGLYMVGTIVLIIGIVYLCHIAHVPQHWVIAISIIALGAGVMGAVTSTRGKDPN